MRVSPSRGRSAQIGEDYGDEPRRLELAAVSRLPSARHVPCRAATIETSAAVGPAGDHLSGRRARQARWLSFEAAGGAGAQSRSHAAIWGSSGQRAWRRGPR